MVVLTESEMREQFSLVLANSGEIRKEYEMELLKLQQERAEQEKASEKLIKEMLAQDEREMAAFRVANKENKPTASTAQLVVRIPLPRRSSSIDSITSEYSRHFKPIARYPRTPPRPDDKHKGYPETIKVTPCPQTVKRLDFSSSCSPPDVVSSSDSVKPALITDNTKLLKPSTSALNSVSPSNSTQDDHTFLLPLHTSINMDDDGLSMVSSSTSTSISTTSRLRIETTSPILALASPWGLSNRPSTENSRNGANSDTISYRSDISSPTEYKLNNNSNGRCVKIKKNGHVNSKSSASKAVKSSSSKVNGVNGHTGELSNEPKPATRSRTMASSTSSNGSSRSDKKSQSRNSSKLLVSTRSAAAVNHSSGVTSTAENVNGVDDGLVISNVQVSDKKGVHSKNGPAIPDKDELYARKLQTMFEMEKRYRLTALRYKGSGNEYNTRKRKRNRTTSDETCCKR